MIKKILFLILGITCTISTILHAQNQDSSLVSIKNFRLDQGTFSWRGTNTYYDMTAWDSSPYTEGNLKQLSGSNWLFRMNYRLLFPQNYNANFSPGYPIILMLHGAGERGNCWENKCYCEGCAPNSTPIPNTTPEYLNNDHVLLNGGLPLLNAVNLAGAKLPGDPTLNARAFPGFVVFPQNESFWGSSTADNSPLSYAIRIVRLLVKQYNIDPNRIYIHGLSFGGQAVYKALNMADWLFAAGVVMSGLEFDDNFDYEGNVTVPLWIFQGGKDTNPNPVTTENFIRKFRSVGGYARYTLYPQLGHGTWNTAYKEPDFFSWFLKYSKNNIYTYYNNSNICRTTNTGVRLSLPGGFPAYQWKKDDAVIAGASSNEYTAMATGNYKARFSRVANPTESQWDPWSAVVTVGEQTPPAPGITQEGTTYLTDINGGKNAILHAPSDYAHYSWFKNGELFLEDTVTAIVSPGDCGTPCSNQGTYTLTVSQFDKCPSLPSSAKYLFFEDQAPIDNGLQPSGFTYKKIEPSKIVLYWNDITPNENGYEVWRKNNTVQNSPWTMAAVTEKNATFYYDTMLTPGTEYYYKIRALGITSRSDYFPGNDQTAAEKNLIVNTSNDYSPPLPPQNLKAVQSGINSITLTWEPGIDADGITQYKLTYGNQVVDIPADANTYTISDLAINNVFNFTLQSVNSSGLQSTASNQATANTYVTGLYYKHSTGTWSDLDDPALVASYNSPDFTGKVENFTLAPRTQEDFFNFQFEGYLSIATAGSYTFYLNSNDGSRLYIDNNLIVDFNGVHSTCSGSTADLTCPNGWGKQSQTVNFTAGPHLIRVDFFDYSGGNVIQVFYQGADTNNSAIAIPSAALKSGTYVAPAPPSAPTNLVATAKGMSRIDLTWAIGSASKFEVYRSLKADVGFAMIGRAETNTYVDSTLQAKTTYYYKLKTVTDNVTSLFSATVQATTTADTEAPTKPVGVKFTNLAATRMTLAWDPSSDNIKVAGYEVMADNKIIGKTTIPAYENYTLDSGKVYSFTIIAYDPSGNRSAASDPISNDYITATEPLNHDNLQLNVYPNPVAAQNMKVQLLTKYNSVVDLKIIDITGRSMFSAAYSAEELREGKTLPIEGKLMNGLYYIVVQQHDSTVKQKVVVKN